MPKKYVPRTKSERKLYFVKITFTGDQNASLKHVEEGRPGPRTIVVRAFDYERTCQKVLNYARKLWGNFRFDCQEVDERKIVV